MTGSSRRTPALDVSVLVVSYNTRELLRAALRSIEQAVQGTPLTSEIIVVDNASGDGSADMVEREFPNVRVCRNQTNRGFAAANNQAIVISDGRYILLVNSDAMVCEGGIEALVRYMDANPCVGIAGGQLLNPDGSFQSSYADFPSLMGELLLATKLAAHVCGPDYPSYPAAQSQTRRSVDWVSGAFLGVRREAIDTVGLLDEEYFMYSEETDWCYRMKHSGWDVTYVPEAKAIHLGGQSFSTIPERRRSQIYRGKWLFLRRHQGPLTAITFRWLIRIISVVKLVIWTGLLAVPSRRQHSLQQVRSYRRLLSHF